MMDARPEILLFQAVHMIATKFQWLNPCSQAYQFNNATVSVLQPAGIQKFKIADLQVLTVNSRCPESFLLPEI
jgi:hypothetical protein